MNEILRRALLSAHLDEEDVAARLEVDPKTVRRWLEGRLPYSRHRWALADLLNLNEADLWPELRSRSSRPDELLAVYPHRYLVPRQTWRHLFASAEHDIGILDYSSLFLAEDSDIVDTCAKKAYQGIRVRIALSDPDSPQFIAHGGLKNIDDATIKKIRRALKILRPLCNIPDIEIRLHCVVLYNSIYRADDDLLCNQYVYGLPAENGPVMHLRYQERGDMARLYVDTFDRIWATAVPLS